MQSKNEGTVKAYPYLWAFDVFVVPHRGLPSSICDSPLCESPHGTISASSKLAKSLPLRGAGLLHLLAASFNLSLSFFESFAHLYDPNVADS
jgi:hypothetical protein